MKSSEGNFAEHATSKITIVIMLGWISVDSEGYQCFAALGRDTGQQETDEVLRSAHRHTQHHHTPATGIRDAGKYLHCLIFSLTTRNTLTLTLNVLFKYHKKSEKDNNHATGNFFSNLSNQLVFLGNL